MSVEKIFAHLDCRDLALSVGWYSKLFERQPDERPMPGLAEWHHGAQSGLQLFERAETAGMGTLTLGVSNLSQEAERLESEGVKGERGQATAFELLQLRDPDGNLVVLTEPKSSSGTRRD